MTSVQLIIPTLFSINLDEYVGSKRTDLKVTITLWSIIFRASHLPKVFIPDGSNLNATK